MKLAFDQPDTHLGIHQRLLVSAFVGMVLAMILWSCYAFATRGEDQEQEQATDSRPPEVVFDRGEP